MPAAISVASLHKRFDALQAVGGVDLEVETGTVFALLGPNGAGKTTTVEILEGFLPRDSGEVRVLGLDPATDRRPLLERIGIVLQETAVEQFLTVRETLARRAALYPHPRRPDDVIETIGLEEKASARVRSLSGGQQRRLDLGLGLVGDPEVLFLDEPTTGFDPNARREAWDVVRRLASEGSTILLTTHYMDEAQALADHVAVIAHGQIVATGTPDSIGGRDTGATTVRFLLPASAGGLADLPLPATGAEATLRASPDGQMVEIVADHPTPLLHALTSWALERNLELERLQVTKPSLEDVYLDITSDEAAGGTP
jgi:ABC-2 type transport system ATP-binding protein